MTFISVVRAQFDYERQGEDELSFQEGDVLCVLGQDEDDAEWMKACLLKDQNQVGLVPNNYVTPVKPIFMYICFDCLLIGSGTLQDNGFVQLHCY